jgi:hypothetical protein
MVPAGQASGGPKDARGVVRLLRGRRSYECAQIVGPGNTDDVSPPARSRFSVPIRASIRATLG